MPITITASGSTTPAFQSDAHAQIDFGNVFGESACSAEAPFSCAPGTPISFSGTYSLGNLSPGNEYGIEELVEIDGNSGASASIDPMISIDPSFADADLYSLIFSPGISAPPPANGVPEPVSLSLFGAGLAGAATLRRRKAAKL